MIRPLRDALIEFRAKVMLDAVLQHNGNVCKAAKSLGIHRNLIYRELRKAGSPLTNAKFRRVQLKLRLAHTSQQK